jgi:kynureninase
VVASRAAAAILDVAGLRAGLRRADILAPIASNSSCRAVERQPLIYLCGHSLGLAPRAALDYVSEELAEWAQLGVAGHHTATRPWIDYAQNFTKGLQHVTGALANEVVAMNSLTDQPAPDDGVVLSARRHARQGAHRGRRVLLGSPRDPRQSSWHKLDRTQR